MTNKQAMREAAQEAAGAYERLSVIPADDIFDISLSTLEGDQLDADITALNAFNESANPGTVLDLLDELEAKDKSINFLKERLAQLANFNPDWDALEAATDSLREHMEELTTARSRIAELEAREVKLPELKMLSDYLQEVTMREREDILLGVKLEFHRELQAAVIRINGEG